MLFIGQCIHDIAVSHGLMISLFLAGLVGGATHCAGMCGPFVLAQIGDTSSIQKLSGSLLIPYHLGRMVTYVGLAILVSSIVNLAFVFSNLKSLIAAPILALAATIFLISAFPKMLNIFPWAAHIRISAPYSLIERFTSKLMRNPGIIKRFGLGVMLGFMPCGLVASALLAASTAPTVTEAALAMSIFTIGTIPALILVAFGGGALKYKYPKASMRISQGAMVISSFWLMAIAVSMVF